MSRQDYFDAPGLNYSTLSGMAKNPQSVMNKERDYSDGMRFGDALDTFIFDGKEVYNERFYVLSTPKPTGQLEILADAYMSSVKPGVVDVSIAERLSVEAGLWKNIKDEEKRSAKIDSSFWDYIQAVNDSEGKIVVGTEEDSLIKECSIELMGNVYTERYFKKSEGKDMLYQVPIYFESQGVTFKSLLDIIEVDHEKKRVIPADLKSMGEYVESFPSKIIKWRYDLQAELYKVAVAHWAEANGLGDYEIRPFRFVVISRQNPNKPMVFRLNSPANFRDKISASRIKPIKGLWELVKEYQWRTDHDEWTYSEDMYYNKCEDL